VAAAQSVPLPLFALLALVLCRVAQGMHQEATSRVTLCATRTNFVCLPLPPPVLALLPLLQPSAPGLPLMLCPQVSPRLLTM
jgi:hypothetical protein